MTDTANPASALAQTPQAESGWTALENRVLVRVSGPGTDKFLQGQFSQNLADVTSIRSPRAAAATPKGRAYCLTRLVRAGDDILMSLPTDLADDITSHLRKYLMLFRGTTMAIESEARIVGILGVACAQAAAGVDAGELQEPGDSTAVTGGYLVKTEPTAEGASRFELWQTGADAAALPDDTRITLADWQASEIAAGIATLSAATQASFVPQMLNWQHVGGIHFKKGCYTGQEVIARMHFLGQLKKSLFRFQIGAMSDVPAPGAGICAHERTVGEVVNAVAFRDGSVELLAVVRHDAADQTLCLADHPQSELTPRALPYSVPERGKSEQPDT